MSSFGGRSGGLREEAGGDVVGGSCRAADSAAWSDSTACGGNTATADGEF